MISRIRFDDVLWETSDPKMKGRELAKFTKHINWCKGLNVQLSPAILCQDIDKFDDAVIYIREQIVENDNFYPDLHGWDHGPYGTRTQAEIEEHLEKAMEWFERNIWVTPIRWVTPHGANSYAIQAAARKFNLIVEDTTPPVLDQKTADNMLRESKDPKCLDDRIIMIHWWERGLRLYRIAEILKAGNVDVAMQKTKETLDEKSWRICWSSWV